MMIGRFKEQNSGYEGEINAFAVEDFGLSIVPAKEKQGNGPDFVVYGQTTEGPGPESDGAELYEVGAAWKKTSKAGKPYLSVKLDGPTLPAPINCALTRRQDGSWVLVWNRKDPASAATEEPVAA